MTKVKTGALVVLVVAVVLSLSTTARGGGRSCPDNFKDGEVFECLVLRKRVKSFGTIIVIIRNGMVNLKFVANRFFFPKKFKVKLACKGGRFTGPTLKASRGKREQLARVLSGGLADIDASAPQSYIACRKSCCGLFLVIKVIKFQICKVIKKGRRKIVKCLFIRNKLVKLSTLRCAFPCGRRRISPLVTAVQDPCPWCVCKDDPSIKAPNGDDRACKTKCPPDCDPRYFKCDKSTDYECVCKEECCDDDMCDPGYKCEDYKCVKKCPDDCEPRYFKCDETTDYRCVCKQECCDDDMCDSGYKCKDYKCVEE